MCRAMLAGAALGALGMAAIASPAQAQNRTVASSAAARTYAISAQDLDDALRQFAIESGEDVVFSADAVRGKRSAGLRGRYTTAEGLRRLLRGTGLVARATGSGFAVTTPGQAGKGLAGNNPGTSSPTGEDDAAISEILVVGSKSQNVDIRRSEDDAQPYIVYDKDTIEKSGARNIDEFLRTRLPQNAAAADPDQNVLSPSTTGQISLRGLGFDQTLVLIDGRRVAATSIGLQQGNIRGVPLAAIERIEVLPTSAAAIYGGSAVGGVVNIVLRHDYRGVELLAEYGNTFDWDTGDFRIGATGGFHIGDTAISFSASHQQTGELLASERSDLLVAARERAIANAPDTVFGNATPFLGRTSNICASVATGLGRCNGAELVLDNGTPLGSSVTFVPEGYPGPVAAGDGGQALVANAGMYNLEAPLNTQAIVQPNSTQSVTVNIRQPVVSWLELFGDLYWDQSRLEFDVPAFESNLLQADDPNNPFQQPIRITTPAVGVSRNREAKTRNLRLTGGGIFRLGGDWSASLEATYATSYSLIRSENFSIPVGSRTAFAQGSVQDVNEFDPDFAALYPDPEIFDNGPTRNRAINLSARAGGPVFTLPAGPVTLNMLAERRLQKVRDFYSQASSTLFVFTPTQRQNINSLYGEVRVPVFSEKNAVPGIYLFDVQASVRHDDYSSRSTSQTFIVSERGGQPATPFDYIQNTFKSTDYLIGGRFAPVKGVTFRASYSTGFLPPDLSYFSPLVSELAVTRVAPVSDPLRGGEDLVGDANGNVIQTAGGNPAIQPETSKSLSFGVIFQPEFAPGLRVAADFTRIRKAGEIDRLNLQQLINLEDSFPDRITRGPNLPGDPVGYAGPIVAYDVSFVNVATREIKAWDFRLDYEFETSAMGRFKPYAVITHVLGDSQALFAGDTPIDEVGLTGGTLPWRGNIGLDWDKGGWAAGWNMQFYDGYNVCRSFDSEAACDSRVAIQGADRIPSQYYHDVYARYSFPTDRGVFSGLEIGAGIQNLFDSKPPVDATSVTFIYALSSAAYADLRGRRFTLSVRKPF